MSEAIVNVTFKNGKMVPTGLIGKTPINSDTIIYWGVVLYVLFEWLTLLVFPLRPILYVLRILIFIGAARHIKVADTFQIVALLTLICIWSIQFLSGYSSFGFSALTVGDASAFGMCLLLLVESGRSRDGIFVLVDICRKIAPITLGVSLLSALYLGVSAGGVGTRIIYENTAGEESFGLFTLCLNPLSLSFLIAPFSTGKNFYDRCAFLGIVFALVLGLLTLTKSVVLFYGSILLINLWYRKKIILGVPIFIICASLFLTLFGGTIFEQIDGLWSRFSVDDVSSGRTDELIALLANSSFSELFWGHGFGAVSLFSACPEFFHYGFANLIFKGGFLYLIVFWVITLCVLLRLKKKREYFFFWIILCFFVKDTGHTCFVYNQAFLMSLFLVYSHALSMKKF